MFGRTGDTVPLFTLANFCIFAAIETSHYEIIGWVTVSFTILAAMSFALGVDTLYNYPVQRKIADWLYGRRSS